ncbi:Uncharacterised protein [Legionella cincinnatiensis]|uniref:Uncharacterized protein n=1 Tax=Legionella cincinnatiensis TaxID=28085 RepID=A0A378IL86_9GAMM|nr:Uncharacterised protein [Legionella cincinnatiensis]
MSKLTIIKKIHFEKTGLKRGVNHKLGLINYAFVSEKAFPSLSS